MDKKLKNLYKKLSKQASEDGYYLIPKTFYEKLSNKIESLRIDLDKSRKARDNWKTKYYNLKND